VGVWPRCARCGLPVVRGWGTALKPAWEPIILARKPLRGTVAANVERYGTGALNIDGCRISMPDDDGWDVPQADLSVVNPARPGAANGSPTNVRHPTARSVPAPAGRWPANLILTDPIFDGDMPGVVGGGERQVNAPTTPDSGETAGYSGGWGSHQAWRPDDGSGTYSRFFLIAKASRADREPVLGGLEEREMHLSGGRIVNTSKGDGTGIRENRTRANVHPTVKPLDLMRHLVRLVTPPGGLVLDPFGGSGTTALACEAEGFHWILIEREEEYCRIAEARLNGVQRGLGIA